MNELIQRRSDLVNRLILLSLCALIIGLPFSNSIIEIAASAAIALWLFRKVFILRSFKLEKTPLNLPLLFYVLFVIFSMVNSRFLMTSLKGFAFKTTEYLLVYFVIVESVKTERDLKRLIAVILFSCALVGIDGVWQYFAGHDFLRGYPLWSSGRITASFKYPNSFGGWLVTVIPLCVSLAIFGAKDNFWRILGASLSLLLIACLVLSITAGACLAIVPAIIFLVWKRGDIAKKALLLFLVIAILGIGILYVSGYKEVISRFTDKGHTVLHRLALAELCWRMFVDHPLLGHGVNAFMSIYESYADRTSFGMSGVSYAHNCYLQIAVETGIFSLLIFIWTVIALFISSLKNINRRKEGFVKTAQIGVLAGLLAYLAHSAFETNLYALPLAILFYYFLGVAISIQGIKEG